MHKAKLLFPLLLLCAIYLACNKDDILTYQPKATVVFAGQIFDENGQAISGALVQAGSEQALTDEQGAFRLAPLKIDKRDAVLHVRKDGYFNFSRALIVQNNSTQTITVQLLKKEKVGSIQAGSGGSVNLPGGASLLFPSNGIVNSNGTAYSGTVQIYARYLDPTAEALAFQMPGDLRGVNQAGTTGVLSTYGMIGVELESLSGETLQLATDAEAEIRMPIAAEQAATAPAEIALWHYDTESARWIEEGAAQRIGNEYVGKVKHFSFWNCDAFSEVVYMEGKVLIGDGLLPLTNAQIRLTVLSNNFKGYAFTNLAGWFGGAVPLGYDMQLEVLLPSECGGQVVYAQTIGPFTSDVVLPDIIINDPSLNIFSVRGQLEDCTGQAVTNGYAQIYWGTTVVAIFTNSNGTISASFAACQGGVQSGTLTAYDLTTLSESSQLSFSAPPNNIELGTIPVCNAVSEFIRYTIDGQQPAVYVDVFAESWQDSLPTNTYYTTIGSLGITQAALSFSFSSNLLPGTYPTQGLLFFPPYVIESNNMNFSTTVTTAATNVGDFFIGTFSGNFTDLGGTPHFVSGDYRVIRD